jgi:serine/threonine protein kinase
MHSSDDCFSLTPELSDVIGHTSLNGLGRLSTNHSETKQPPSTDIVKHMDPSAKYKLLEQVGNGSFGVVYKAVNKETGEVVAIKEVCARLRAD